MDLGDREGEIMDIKDEQDKHEKRKIEEYKKIQ